MFGNMEKTLQQRLVGAVVLVALGVILVPALLDGSGYKSRHDRNIDIPDKPLLPALKEVKAPPVTIATPVDTRRERVEQKKKDIPPKPIESWSLQVGTFSQEDNALAFRDSLRKEGYIAYSEMSTSNGKQSYRVRIGPELEKDALEKLQIKLKAEKKIDGFILKHP
ncbi:MAG: SPOR domain-containing protein [Gammaproteobacteria bacterium]|nr:SPOR domain-containing protein [Gammaproteobacteria bacterium]